MEDERRTKLDAVIKRRDSLREAVQRAKGRKDAAEKELAVVEKECEARGIAPDQLGATIEKLTLHFNKEVEALSERVKSAEEAIKPFVEGTRV
jgi:predicted  nucleic acid-binding Zn-ribbon protein